MPLELTRAVNINDQNEIHQFARQFIPSLEEKISNYAVCLYTMSPDHHFILGHHPRHHEIIIASGFSGHGFKFSSVVGEIIANLALNGNSSHPIEFLSPQRFSCLSKFDWLRVYPTWRLVYIKANLIP